MPAFALGIATFALDMREPATVADDATVLDTYYPMVFLDEYGDDAALLAGVVGHAGGSASYRLDEALLDRFDEALAGRQVADGHRDAVGLAVKSLRSQSPADDSGKRSPQRPVLCFIEDLAAPAVDAHDVYLRLHLLSHRKIQPHGCNMDGIFGKLANVAWTDQGPYLASQVDCVRAQLRMAGVRLTVSSVDKFPRMTDYVVPGGVRIADADRVRLGAHLAEGTTIMHEGFVNFNAGTLGASMVEGRISAGVVVGDGSDVGGGASIMGTLSGGGKAVISVGQGSLLGANAGIGISLGDQCTVEAGTYVTAGAKVRCTWDGEVRKAAELSGRDGLLFRRHSVDGSLEAVDKANQVALNEALHAN